MELIRVYLEEGQKKTFVVAPDWPGLARWGKDEPGAFDAFLAVIPRYAAVIRAAGVDFQIPSGLEGLEIVAGMEGNASTDFGGLGNHLEEDQAPLRQQEYQHFLTILKAAWKALDQAITQAQGKELLKGPRGGGRDLEKMIGHVLQSDQAYLRRLAWKFKYDLDTPQEAQKAKVREAILEALEAGMRGEIPEKGPRGGKIWPLRFYFRVATWHTLDHAWEIEDRII